MKKYTVDWNKLVFSMICILYFLYYIQTADQWHLIDNLNLIIHEAGHWVFLFSGDLLNILGGSLTQILVPVLFTGYFWSRVDYYSAYIMLFWAGQNFINVSIYIKDAIVMQLPLLGGTDSIHDWNFLLSKFNILKDTQAISSATFFIGVLCIIFACLGSLWYSRKDMENYA